MAAWRLSDSSSASDAELGYARMESAEATGAGLLVTATAGAACSFFARKWKGASRMLGRGEVGTIEMTGGAIVTERRPSM